MSSGSIVEDPPTDQARMANDAASLPSVHATRLVLAPEAFYFQTTSHPWRYSLPRYRLASARLVTVPVSGL